jgi:hypothetical protein
LPLGWGAGPGRMAANFSRVPQNKNDVVQQIYRCQIFTDQSMFDLISVDTGTAVSTAQLATDEGSHTVRMPAGGLHEVCQG